MSPQYGKMSLYQAVSQSALADIHCFNGGRLCPGAAGDQFALLKMSRSRAREAARYIARREQRRSAVVLVELQRQGLIQLELESVAYDEHREYRVPIALLDKLSVALARPLTALERVGVEPSHPPFQHGLLELDGDAGVLNGCARPRPTGGQLRPLGPLLPAVPLPSAL